MTDSATKAELALFSLDQMRLRMMSRVEAAVENASESVGIGLHFAREIVYAIDLATDAFAPDTPAPSPLAEPVDGLAYHEPKNGSAGEAEGRLRSLANHIHRLGYFPPVSRSDTWAADLRALLTRTETAEREREAHKDRQVRHHTDGYAAADERAARYGFKRGGLQWAWRQGERSDPREVEDAICDALQMGGIYAWPGDGVGCAAQIVTRQMDEKATALRERDEARAWAAQHAIVTSEIATLTADRDRLQGLLAAQCPCCLGCHPVCETPYADEPCCIARRASTTLAKLNGEDLWLNSRCAVTSAVA